MHHAEETQVFIRLAAHGMSFFCTVTDNSNGSSFEELVEIIQRCDAPATADEWGLAPGVPANIPWNFGDGPWCRIGHALAHGSRSSAAAAVSHLFATGR